MSSHRGQKAAIVLMLGGAIGVGALAYYVKSTPDASHIPVEIKRNDQKKHSEEVSPKPEATSTEVKPTGPTVRLPVIGDEDINLSRNETPVPEGQQPMHFVAQSVADAVKIDGAKVLGIDVRDHVAIVNFNAAVEKGMGSMEEGKFLQALQIGFGQFKDIDRIAIESEGAPMTSGHVDLSDPLPVVRPGEKPSDDPGPKSGEA